jgi:hypothetical protein
VGIVRSGNSFGFITQGYAEKLPDPWLIQPQNVVGKVYFNTSFLLSAAKFLRTPLGFILLLALPLLIVFGRGWQEIRRQNKRQQPSNLP